MKSLFKFILWSVGLVVIFVMAVGVAVISMDPNEHKDWIISQAEKNLGRDSGADGWPGPAQQQSQVGRSRKAGGF